MSAVSFIMYVFQAIGGKRGEYHPKTENGIPCDKATPKMMSKNQTSVGYKHEAWPEKTMWLDLEELCIAYGVKKGETFNTAETRYFGLSSEGDIQVGAKPATPKKAKKEEAVTA